MNKCDICQCIVFSHSEDVKLEQPACVVRAALKHIDKHYQSCGRELDMQFERSEEVVDANQFMGLDVVEGELVE